MPSVKKYEGQGSRGFGGKRTVNPVTPPPMTRTRLIGDDRQRTSFPTLNTSSSVILAREMLGDIVSGNACLMEQCGSYRIRNQAFERRSDERIWKRFEMPLNILPAFDTPLWGKMVIGF